MQKMPDMQGTGEKKFYPKVKHALCIPHDTIGSAFVKLTTIPRGWFEGVMKGLPEVLNSYLEEGHGRRCMRIKMGCISRKSISCPTKSGCVGCVDQRS